MMRILLALALALPFAAFSQPYPSKPVRLIVTYPAGGGADALARADRAEPRRGPRPAVPGREPGGASGAIAAELVAKVVKIPEVREQTANWAKIVRAGNSKVE